MSKRNWHGTEIRTLENFQNTIEKFNNKLIICDSFVFSLKKRTRKGIEGKKIMLIIKATQDILEKRAYKLLKHLINTEL